MAHAARARLPDVVAVDETCAPTLQALYTERARLTPAAPACRWLDEDRRDWSEISWGDLQRRMSRFAAGLHQAGLMPGDRVALQMPNGPDWLAIDWACHLLGLVVVGLYNEDTPASAASMLADSGARCAFLRTSDCWSGLCEADRLPELQTVVLMRGCAPVGDPRAQALVDWLPPEAELPPSRAVPEALATIVYTSGATGTPKGVMLSHANIVSNVFACLRAVNARGDDLRLSILPLAHMFERTAGAYLAVACGACTAYSRGLSQLAEDLQQHRPTVLIAVPRVFERLHALLATQLEHAGAPRRVLFRLAVEAGWRAQCRDSGVSLLPVPASLSRLVGQRLREQLGGRLRLAVSGGAPLSPQIARTFIALGVPVLQGYGLTEAGPVVSTNRAGDNEPASAGLPLDNVETRASYEGELLVRGPSVMMGYWRDREATKLAIDDAGWLHTGDKVSRLDARRVYLTGRLKEIIVTATGEKAAPSEIEQRLREYPVVDQVMVVGEARPYLAALILPDKTQLVALRASLGIAADDNSGTAIARLEQAVFERCHELLRCAPKNHQVRRIVLVAAPWTIDNGMMTASQKLKRAAIARQHAADIERLYSGHFKAPQTDCSHSAGV